MANKRCLLCVKRDGKDIRCHLKYNGDRILYYDRSLIPTVKFSILPAPEDSYVELKAIGYEQSGNEINVTRDTRVDWTVSKEKYKPQSNYLIVTQDIPLDGLHWIISPTLYSSTGFSILCLNCPRGNGTVDGPSTKNVSILLQSIVAGTLFGCDSSTYA